MDKFVKMGLAVAIVAMVAAACSPSVATSSSAAASTASSVAASKASSASTTNASSASITNASSSAASSVAQIAATNITNAITVLVAVAPTATNLIYPSYTNIPMIVGSLCGAATNLNKTNSVIGSWAPTAAIGFMQFVSNINLADADGTGTPCTVPLYGITLYVPFTNQANQATSYSFVNTTYPFGSGWGNQEQSYSTTTGNMTGFGNRTFVITYSNAVQTVWLTNPQANLSDYSTGVDVMGVIELWAGVGPTYNVNCSVKITMTNVLTNDTTALNNMGPVSVGDEMYLWGSYNSDLSALSSNQIVAANNGTVNFVFTYNGSASVNWAGLYTNDGWNPAYQADAAGDNFAGVIPAGATSFIVTNTGNWRCW